MWRSLGISLLSAAVLAVAGCGTSNTLPPTSPQPQSTPTPAIGSVSITSISPSSAAPGNPDLTVTITGSNLDLTHTGSHQTNTVAVWSAGGVDTSLTTTVVSGTQITAVVPANLLSKPITAQISVQKWYFADDTPFAVSNSLGFEVASAPNSSVSPSAVTLGPKGSQQFTANIDGSSSVTWSIAEGANRGSITDAGLYTPANIGNFHVIATSTSNPSETATAVVSVVATGFAETESMHSARSGHTATLLMNGQVLIAGGGDAAAELFDPLSGTFSLTGNLQTNRLLATATLLADGRVLIAGGLGTVPPAPGSRLPSLNTAEIFDPETGLFSPTGNMVAARWKHTATLLNNGKVLIAGGNGDGFCTVGSAELFDPLTGTFSSTGSLVSERVGHTSTMLDTGEVLIAGGSNGCAPDAADDPPWDPFFVELYNPLSGSFQEDATMSTTRIGHVAVCFSDEEVLILGGIPNVQNIHEQPPNPSYAELYDTATHAMSPVSGVTISQNRYSATLLTNGLILIAGGSDAAGNVTSAAELLDPHTDTFTGAGALAQARVGHTATLLKDGRVLVTGGSGNEGNPLSTAEIYQ